MLTAHTPSSEARTRWFSVAAVTRMNEVDAKRLIDIILTKNSVLLLSTVYCMFADQLVRYCPFEPEGVLRFPGFLSPIVFCVFLKFILQPSA
jgi:hypothetical protein